MNVKVTHAIGYLRMNSTFAVLFLVGQMISNAVVGDWGWFTVDGLLLLFTAALHGTANRLIRDYGHPTEVGTTEFDEIVKPLRKDMP